MGSVWPGEVNLALEEWGQARNAVDEAMRQVQEIGDRVTCAFVERMEGQLELADGRRESAKELLTNSYETFSRLSMQAEAKKTQAILSGLE